MTASFLRIDKALLADPKLSFTAKLVFALLLDHRNENTEQCNPKRRTLAQELGINGKHTGPRAITRALRELREAGLVQSQQKRYANAYALGGTKSTNLGGTKSTNLGGTYCPPCPSGPFTEPTQENLRARAKRDAAFPLQRKSMTQLTLEAYHRRQAAKRQA